MHEKGILVCHLGLKVVFSYSWVFQLKYTWILCDPECFYHEVASLSDWGWWHFSSRSPAAQHWSEASGQRKASVWVCPGYSECCHSDRSLRLENSGCLDLWRVTLIDSLIRDIGGHTFMKPWVQTGISENISCNEKHPKSDDFYQFTSEVSQYWASDSWWLSRLSSELLSSAASLF